MDATSMMLITVPILFPLAQQLGFDLVWFGLFVLITIEMAGTTPPFGLLLYVMMVVAPKGTTPVPGRERGFSVPDMRREPNPDIGGLSRSGALVTRIYVESSGNI